MSRYLMVLWSGGGGVPPPLAIAKRLVRAGHEVTVLAPRSLAEPVRATGAILEPYRRAPEHDASDPKLDLLRDWEVSGMAARVRMRDNVVFGTAPAICDDVLALTDENRPDAIVTDYLMVGAYVAAEKAGIPLAALMHTIYTQPRPGVPSCQYPREARGLIPHLDVAQLLIRVDARIVTRPLLRLRTQKRQFRFSGSLVLFQQRNRVLLRVRRVLTRCAGRMRPGRRCPDYCDDKPGCGLHVIFRSLYFGGPCPGVSGA